MTDAATYTPAFDAAYRRHRRLLLAVARNWCPSSLAEDVLHTSFAVALEQAHAGRVDMSRPLYPYLRAIVSMRARAFWRLWRDVIYDPELQEEPSAPASALTRLQAKSVWDELTTSERLAVANLHILEEQLTRADQGLFARRIRIAGQRLKAQGLV